MSEQTVRVELPLILPGVPGSDDACIERLRTQMPKLRGILDAHVVRESGREIGLLCIHYDGDMVSLREVQQAASRTGAELEARYGHTVVRIRAIGGEDVARRIEGRLGRMDGVVSASVSLPAQAARVEFEASRMDEERIREALKEMGYEVDGDSDRTPSRRVGEWTSQGGWLRGLREHRELSLSLLAGLALALAWTGARWFGLPKPIELALYLGSYLLGAWDLVRHWVGALRKGEVAFDIDLLMLVAALGAAALGAWAEGGFLLFLFSLAHALEHMALDRARGAIRALADLAPATARVLRDGEMLDVPVEEVRPGEWVVVRPAERIPVDGSVQKGRSSVNQAPITGESMPVEKEVGDEVHAGTVNGEGALHIQVTRAAGDRTLDRVIKLVEEAQTKKAPTERFTDRFTAVFVPIVLGVAVVLAIGPPALGFWSWGTGFYRAMALLVAASPCALAIGTPSAVLAGIAQAARNGILVKGGVHLERLGAVEALAMDKTGTLTVGHPEVTELSPHEGASREELLVIGAAVERNSQHPLAKAVVRRATSEALDLPEAGELTSLTARGVRSSVGGLTVEIGSLRLWEEAKVAVPDALRSEVNRLAADGQSVMAVRHGERWLGVIGLSDQPRAGATAILSEIRNLGIKTIVMMTGDNRGVAEAVARGVGIDEVMAELLPEQKVEGVRELLERHGSVAMVGDGVNDAPALATATVGIAMGGAGTAAALETADIALMGDDLAGIPFAIGLSRMTRRIIRQNLLISLSVIGSLILATTTGIFGIGLAVVVHEGSTLLVVGNALRILRYGPDQE